jgi:hypothetical protein
VIAKGFAVSFDMKNGDQIDAPAAFALLHDPSGRYWKKTSLLVAPFHKDGVDVDGSELAQDYLRRDVKAGSIDLPPKPLSAWQPEGEIDCIYYRRNGARHGGQRFKHKFNEFSLDKLVRGSGKARLYSRGRLFRVELPRGAVADSDGLKWP